MATENTTFDNMEHLVESLRQRLLGPLPGQAAQFKMVSPQRLLDLGINAAVPAHAKVACVLILLHQYPDEEQVRLVLIRRTANPNDRHSGQISFPGGRWEPSDGSLEAVALREAHEEIGVSPLQVQPVGRLTELYIPVSNFLVHPFVGILRGHPDFKPQPGEVEEILTPPYTLFQDTETRKKIDLNVYNGMVFNETPYFDVDGHVVWGATAMILSELIEVLG